MHYEHQLNQGFTSLSCKNLHIYNKPFMLVIQFNHASFYIV